ncbi:unnamed protein product [Calypogeia fissa]
MAEAAGTGRIDVPQFGSSSSGSFKAGGRNGAHEEMAKNLAAQLNLDGGGGGGNGGGGGSELTSRSKASWAGQMKDEHEGVTGEIPIDSAPKSNNTNNNKNKKNKKKMKEGGPSIEVDQSVETTLEAGGMVAKSSQPSGSSWPQQPVAVSVAPSGWDDLPPPADVAVEDSGGWNVSGGESVGPSAAYPSNGNWDEVVAPNRSSEWDSGWEVAGSRRGKKKGEDFSGGKTYGGPNPNQQKGRGGGRGGFQSNNSGDSAHRGAKNRYNEWEKVSTGRGAGAGGRSPGGHSFQEKGGRRPAPRNPAGPSSYGGAAAAARQPPTQSSWGKPLNKSVNNSSNWDTLAGPVQGAHNGNGDNSANSVSSFGNLPPASSEPNPGGVHSLSGLSIDAWKGGFPAFSGNGSSVFEDSPASLYSDSQFSDDDFDSDTLSLGSFESEESHKSHSTQRKNKWFRNFFQDLDLLTEEQLHEHDRQWHCPACQGGVGAIDWYRGLQPLLAHAKTVRSKRVKLHKSFAEVLEEEIRIRGAALGTHGSGKYGKWRGLGDENESKQIVWPPMVVIRNTQLEQDEDDKWIGMGNKELLDLFKKHNPVKARHAYGPQGHRGISVLIFAESPTGYYNAQRLETQFVEARRGKDNWNAAGKLLFQPGGDRILYGYMATAEDLETFNKHSKGKQKLKWEQKSFHDMVLSPMRKLDEENKKVTILQVKVQREQETGRALKKTMSQISRQLEMRDEEVKIIRNRAREQHQQQQMELNDMEELYKEKIEQLKKEILEKEVTLERVHKEYEQEHIEQCEKLEEQVSKLPKEDQDLSDEQQQQKTIVMEEIARHSQLVEMCIKNQEQWEARKAELLNEQHKKKLEFKERQGEELIQFIQALERERVEILEASLNFITKAQSLSPGSSSEPVKEV